MAAKVENNSLIVSISFFDEPVNHIAMFDVGVRIGGNFQLFYPGFRHRVPMSFELDDQIPALQLSRFLRTTVKDFTPFPVALLTRERAFAADIHRRFLDGALLRAGSTTAVPWISLDEMIAALRPELVGLATSELFQRVFPSGALNDEEKAEMSRSSPQDSSRRGSAALLEATMVQRIFDRLVEEKGMLVGEVSRFARKS